MKTVCLGEELELRKKDLIPESWFRYNICQDKIPSELNPYKAFIYDEDFQFVALNRNTLVVEWTRYSDDDIEKPETEYYKFEGIIKISSYYIDCGDKTYVKLYYNLADNMHKVFYIDSKYLESITSQPIESKSLVIKRFNLISKIKIYSLLKDYKYFKNDAGILYTNTWYLDQLLYNGSRYIKYFSRFKPGNDRSILVNRISFKNGMEGLVLKLDDKYYYSVY